MSQSEGYPHDLGPVIEKRHGGPQGVKAAREAMAPELEGPMLADLIDRFRSEDVASLLEGSNDVPVIVRK